jgi:hypothetical protein
MIQFEISQLDFGGKKAEKKCKKCKYCDMIIRNDRFDKKFCCDNCRHEFWLKGRNEKRKTTKGRFYLMKCRFRWKINAMNPEQRKVLLKDLKFSKEFVDYKINILNDLLKTPKIKTEIFITELELKKEVEKIRN